MLHIGDEGQDHSEIDAESDVPLDDEEHPPPDYESPDDQDYDEDDTTPRASEHNSDDRTHLLVNHDASPPIPTYEAATGAGRGRSESRT